MKRHIAQQNNAQQHVQQTAVIATALVFLSNTLPMAIAADNRGGMDEVIVTAQKREQNLQEVPVAVTAFSGVQLEDAGVETISDLERLSPNTTLRSSRATNTTLTAYIRGIGQNDPLWGFEPGVGLYIDDVYIARPQGALLDTYDVERIEVLRGPQGTLYGKNTIGGAIKYVTRRLSGNTEGNVKVGVGNYNQRDVSVSAQTPLIKDSLNIGATVASFERDGFGTNRFNGDDNYNKDVSAARVTAEWTPAEKWFVRLSGDWTEDKSNARAGTRLVPSLITGEPPQRPYDSNAGLAYDQRVITSGGALTISWDISDAFSLKSITAYRQGSSDGPIDFDATPRNTFDAPARYSDHQTTQEFQLNYQDERLKVVGGLYYFKGYAAGAFDVVAGAALGLPPVIPGNEVAPTFVATTAGSVDTTSKAVYVHSSYDLTSQLTLNLGARYNEDEKDADVFKASYLTNGRSNMFGGTNLATVAIQSDFSDGDTWRELSPKAGIDWKINEDLMLYYSYSEGYKSGGVNMRADARASPAGLSHVFDPETAETHEVGIKSELLERRLRLNLAYFQTKYDNVQVTTNRLVGVNFVPLVITDNSQDIRGIELETTAQLSERLTMVFNYGWIDAEWTKFTDFTAGGAPFDASDIVVVSNTPKNNALLGFNYDHEFGSYGHVVFGVNASYTGKIATEILADSPINAEDYTLFGANVSWYSADKHWNVALHGRNLTDERYLIAGYNFPNFLGENSITGFYGDPRTYTLNVAYLF